MLTVGAAPRGLMALRELGEVERRRRVKGQVVTVSVGNRMIVLPINSRLET